MNANVEEWLGKADGDFHTACRELDAVESPNYDAVCFHAQQCVEKMIKAILIDRGVAPPRTHDLVVLYDLLLPLRPDADCALDDLRHLTHTAVAFRYPGDAADQEDAAETMAICRRLRQTLLGLIERR